jgi:hypothetical protein
LWDVRSVARFSVGVSLLAVACAADIDGVGPSGSAPGLGGGASTGGSNAGGGAPGVSPTALAGPSLRLLTTSQYRATLRTLFSFADELPIDLEEDVALNGLRAIGTSNIALSPKATEAYVHAAEVASERAFGTPAAAMTTAGCDIAQATCAATFLSDFGRRAFRRSLNEEERARFSGIYQAGVSKLGSGAAGLKYAAMAILTSPHFMYRVELGQPTGGGPSPRALTDVETASKLAYFLWNGPPDKELLDLAESGALKASGALATQAGRLLAAGGVAQGMDALFSDYLNLTDLAAVEKLPGRFPLFTPTLLEAMQKETLMSLSRAALGTSDFRGIFNSTKTFVNGELAALYGVSGVSGADFVEVELPAATGRRGLLGQASMLSLHSHASVSSPTLRGKFIRQILLCQAIPAPPPDVDTTLPDESEAKTARQRLTIHSTNTTCAGCHTLMDPIGLGLENFDAIGAYRVQDNGENIDASGELDGVTFSGSAGLADALAQHPSVPGCFARVLFRYAWARLETQADEAFIGELSQAFSASSFQMRQLVTSAVTAPSFAAVGELDP